MGNCASSAVAPAPRGKSSRNRCSTSKGGDGDLFQSKITDNGFLSHCTVVSRQGGKGCNQDAVFACERIFGTSTASICGVFDGHGPHGHVVARHVRDSLPQQLVKALKAHLRPKTPARRLESDSNHETSEIKEQVNERLLMTNDSLTYYSTESTFGGNEIPLETHVVYETADKESWVRAIADSFRSIDESLKPLKKASPKHSGCTAVVAFWHGIELTVANLGDSRCILGTCNSDGHIVPVQLTTDQKPGIPEERRRIENRGGRVMPLAMSPEIQRVWLPNEDSPGLAMSRAFGDHMLKRYGVTNVPAIHCRKLTTADKFVVLATDGVWDVMTNQEVVDIVSRSFPQEAASEVSKEARKRWDLSYRPTQVDDVSVAVLHLPSSWSQIPKPPPADSAAAAPLDHWSWDGQ